MHALYDVTSGVILLNNTENNYIKSMSNSCVFVS